MVIYGCTYFLSGCLEPYDPPSIASDTNILVVDGFVDSEEHTALVSIKRTLPLTGNAKPAPESNAIVLIEQENGPTYELVEEDSGQYALTGVFTEPAARVRLHVRTASSKTYVSEFVTIRTTPKIDSIVWRPTTDGVFININTHDDTGQTRYYKWDFVETWQYHAEVYSAFKNVGGTPVFRNSDEYIYTCWKTSPSTNILVGSTVRLTNDIVREFHLTFLPVRSSELSIKYSTIVRQRSISKEEYSFYEQVQTTTEGIGGLFDPQPSAVPGNISCSSNPGEVVLGYFSAGNTQEQTLFLDFQDLPDYLKKQPASLGCDEGYKDTNQIGQNDFLGSAVYEGRALVGYTITNAACADCRKKGGVTTRPAFWP